MQKYRIEIALTASADIDRAFRYIYEQSATNAKNWLEELYRRLDSLETFPKRCGLIRERHRFRDEVRELLHHSHRILFTVDDERRIVLVHAVRHAARNELRGDEL